MTATTPGIQIENLTKTYEDLIAVDNLNLTIPPGEFLCCLGPNGAGKTTTIKMITGLIRPTSGRVLISGYDVQQHPVEAKRRIGYVPDQPYMYEKLSGREFFQFVGDLFSIPRDVQAAKLDYYLDLFEIKHAADKLIDNYSHGMRQKLVIAASLMHDPEVILVDEPMVGLDPQSARTVKQLFREQAAAGRTLFLCTHVLSVAEELADRIVIFKRGKVIFLGSLPELRARMGTDDNLEQLFLDLTRETQIA
jgi:ABC-2 type transport system ATP-binding protein